MRIFISGPSGVGKSTIIRRILADNPNLVLSISYTTRKPRPAEEHGRDYFFITQSEFEAMIDRQEFLEWAEVHSNYYGTSLSWVEQKEAQGMDVLFDIDVQGVAQARGISSPGAYVMIVPPDMETLRQRLDKRATEDEASLNIRLDNARRELSRWQMYDYLVINDNLDEAVSHLQSVIKVQHNTTQEMIGDLAWLKTIE